MNKPNLIWEKWIDPLGRNKDKFPEFENEITYERENYSDDSFDINDSPRAVLTTCGVIPLKPYNNPATAFNWWILHTGFKLTRDMIDGLVEIDGIEVLDHATNYRIRFAIAMAYDEDDVKKSVNEFLTEELKNS